MNLRPLCPLIRGCHTYILYPQMGLKICAHCPKIKEIPIGPSEIKHLKRCIKRDGRSVHG